MGETASTLRSIADLVDYIAGGCKPAEQWRIGTEHEKFVFDAETLRPAPYEGERGIRALLLGLQTLTGWQPIMEGEHIVGLSGADWASVTLEPGGQLELSGAPLETIHQTCCETRHHLEQVKQVAGSLGLRILGMGFQPKWGRDDIPWMPKGRYRIMRDYMPKRGGKGLDMMLRTCTVQVNLDFSSEADMVEKFRVALALQPLATALFADSPFREGKPTGLLSTRSDVWTDTDPDRCGMIPFVFDPDFGFERYVRWMLDVPMYFVYRNGRYIDASGQSFRDFLAGKLPALPGEFPTAADWSDHLTTAFPEVRLKKYLEMRGADGGPWRRLCALPAFWTGLLYEQGALDGAWSLVKDWTMEQREQLRRDAPRLGLKTMVGKRPLRDIALEVLDLSAAGLTLRQRRNPHGKDEALFLDTLRVIAETGQTPAEEKLTAFHGRWHERIEPVFDEFAY